MEEFNLLEKFECHKKKIIENIDAAKDMELNNSNSCY